MLVLGPLGFAAPWLLAAVLALPILWWLLRAVPPKPAVRKFPGVSLLVGLIDPEKMPDRTPWWLLMLRVLALAAAMIGFAGPVLNPDNRPAGSGPLLVLIDGSWASAAEWQDLRANVADVLDRAQADGRTVALHAMTAPLPSDDALPFRDAAEWSIRLPAMEPQAWPSDRAGFAEWLDANDAGSFETLWFTDGLANSADESLFAILSESGPVTLFDDGEPALAITGPVISDQALLVEVLRSKADAELTLTISAIGSDPIGIERVLGQSEAIFGASDLKTEARFEMPLELRNRVSRMIIQGVASAGAVALLDESSRRRKVGLVAGVPDREAQQYVSPMFYLKKALAPSAELIEVPLADLLPASPDVIILADVGRLPATEAETLAEWVRMGGLLVRFAGPRLAQSGTGQLEDDPLLPVQLRAGGRNLGGAMSWGTPKTLRPFPAGSPFQGLAVPGEITVTSQVMAQPGPDLSGKVLAALEDGTPLVTGQALGEGKVILFHVTANAEWSNLPLSGLFVEMLERLTASARVAVAPVADLTGETWTPVKVLNGFGQFTDSGLATGVSGERLAEGGVGHDMPPGIYAAGERQVAINLMQAGSELAAMAAPPSNIIIGSIAAATEIDLKPLLLLLALALIVADVLGTLWVSGRLTGPRVAAAVLFMLAISLTGGRADAQSGDEAALLAANNSVLAYVLTGDDRVDAISLAGLRGLSRILTERTAIEPVAPVAVDVESDELAFYPFLYWPISELQPSPTDAAFTKLNTYLRHGGMIMFDTRDANLGRSAGASSNAIVLQRLTAKLDIPPLEPMPRDHVLTRTFYLLQEFPGRWTGSDVWVEAAPAAETMEGMPFRNLNDGVTPVIIGGNDWAAAWALDENGSPMFPVGRGVGGEGQREIAWRFGVNVIMHVMTGNYKSDQVHVPALLERLGQ